VPAKGGGGSGRYQTIIEAHAGRDTQHREEETDGEDVAKVERASREGRQGESRHKGEESPRQNAGHA